MVDRERLSANLASVRARITDACIRGGRQPGSVRMVAVTKTVGPGLVKALYDLGVRDFGENRAQVGVPKAGELDFPDARWHFIGNLQRRKVKDILPIFRIIHSVEREELIREVQKRAAAADCFCEVFLEVKTSDEDEKHGAGTAEIKALIDAVEDSPNLKLSGLMTMAPFVEKEKTRPFFRMLRDCRDTLRDEAGSSLPDLSMGMSNDFEIATEEGATVVRIGSALFEGVESE